MNKANNMADTQPITTKRDAHIARLKERYPDKKFEDDEEIYGQISDDYDQYEQDLGEYRMQAQKLSDMMASDPRSAQLLVDMRLGQDPVIGLVRNYGLEIRDVLDDPEMQEQIAEANKEYIERLAKSKELDAEYDRNMSTSLETLRQFQEERGISDNEIDQAMEFLLGVLRDGVLGKFSYEVLDMACKAINHDADVMAANEEGEIAGRNAKIVENLRKSKKGDGTSPLGGKNGQGGRRYDSDNMFDLANEAMY